jgi:choline dehydrogenase-like flavoprotein
MRTTVKRAVHFLFSVVGGCGIYAVMPEAASQEAGWITLFDGKDLDGWDQVGGSNWHVAAPEPHFTCAIPGGDQVPLSTSALGQ